MGAHRRLILALAAVGLAVGVSGCAPGPADGPRADPPVGATAVTVTSTDPATAAGQDGDVDLADGDDTQVSEPEETVRRAEETTQRPIRGVPQTPTAKPTQGGTPGTSRTIVPGPTHSPYTFCPDISELSPVLSVRRLGVDPDLGTDVVQLAFTYTNPKEHALFLMGSVGYVDSEGYESDLYARPGGLVFDDFRLERGTHTVVLELEDVWGEAPESSIYFTYWSLAGTALDSSRPIPCEPSRGYSSH